MFQSAVDPHKLEVFLEINNHLNSRSFDLNGMFQEILESAMELTMGEAASLLLWEESSQRLKFVIALGPKGPDVKSFVLKKGEGIAGWVVEKNTSLHVPDVAKDRRFASQISKDIGYPTQNILAVPLRVVGKCVGVLEIINKKNGHDFSLEDLTWLELFANQAGIAVQNAQSIQTMKDELQELRNNVGTRVVSEPFLTADRALGELLDLVRKYATTDSTVLILGENGTGKERIAEILHEESPRASRPFIRINCAALPDHLLESELFGHKKGAFTDAVSDRKGRFEQAHGGTLFLDEIGTLSPFLQAKLLRVLQSRVVEPVGSSQGIPVDVRIVAATNQNLLQAIESGEFRQDLYYRLHVLPVVLPPLRERPADIRLLSQVFLSELSPKFHKVFQGFDSLALQALLDYTWPGNVRELKNVIERACLVASGPLVHASDLGISFRNEEAGLDLKASVAQHKAEMIAKTLEACRGNQTQAAKRLGIQRTYLSKLIKELNLEHIDKGVQHVG